MNPLALVLLIPLALALAAWGWQIYPRTRLVAWALLPALCSLALLSGGGLLGWVIGLDVLLAVVVAADLATIPGARWFTCEREMGRIASLQKPHPVKLTIGNRSTRPLSVSVRDDVPAECRAEPEQFGLRLPPQSRSMVEYALEPERRGAFRLESVYLRLSSRLGFWQRHVCLPAAGVLHVYPDMRQLREYCAVGADQPAEPAGNAAHAPHRARQRVRAAARLHARRQLQVHRLAQHRPPRQADGQGFPGQPEPARALAARLRANDERHVRGHQHGRPRAQRGFDVELCRAQPGRHRGPALLCRRDRAASCRRGAA